MIEARDGSGGKRRSEGMKLAILGGDAGSRTSAARGRRNGKGGRRLKRAMARAWNGVTYGGWGGSSWAIRPGTLGDEIGHKNRRMRHSRAGS